MKNLAKILMISSLAGLSLFASDKLVIDFEKQRLSQNPNVKIKNIKVFYKKELEAKGWYAYILDINASIQNKNMNVKDTIFSDGKNVATDLFDISTGKSLKDSVVPNLNEAYYKKSHLIAGNEKAKDKIVVFSDPLCPYCVQYIPELISFVGKNSDSLALYYYSFPLTNIHPAATPLSVLIEIAKEKIGKEAILKAYSINWEKYFSPKSTDEKIILEAFNKEMKTDIKIEDLQKKENLANLEKDISMGDNALVNGTPTVYINGQRDSSKELYKTLIKK